MVAKVKTKNKEKFALPRSPDELKLCQNTAVPFRAGTYICSRGKTVAPPFSTVLSYKR